METYHRGLVPNKKPVNQRKYLRETIKFEEWKWVEMIFHQTLRSMHLSIANVLNNFNHFPFSNFFFVFRYFQCANFEIEHEQKNILLDYIPARITRRRNAIDSRRKILKPDDVRNRSTTRFLVSNKFWIPTVYTQI